MKAEMEKKVELLMSPIIKKLIKSAKNEWIMSKWQNTLYHILGMEYTTRF